MRLPFQRPAAPAPADRAGDDAVQAARTQARRRLVGALVLLAAGVIGFPLLFETQPRPVPIDTPIVTAQRDAVPGVVRAVPARPVPPPEPVADGANVPFVAASAAPAPQAVARGAPANPPATQASGARERREAVAPKAPAAAPRQTAPAAPAPMAASPGEGRFVVQVGAYTDVATLRDARQRVEKLGFKTYTQVVESDSGKRTRVRVGPFATRPDAQAAAVKLKAAGLPANLLAL